MRVLLIHPNHLSGGAEIAGNWPPAWAAYFADALRDAGFSDVRFIDAMTNNVTDEALAEMFAPEKPDIVGATSITPSIYKAERALQIAKEAHPQAITLLGGVRATFMFKQVLSEAPGIDAIVRGEGEEILVEVVRAVESGAWRERRRSIKGRAYAEGEGEEAKIVATEAAATVKNLDAINPDCGILEWEKYRYIPMNTRVAIPNMARGCPPTCLFCSQRKFWRDYRVRDPKKGVNDIETLVNKYQVRVFILADEEPTINRKKFVQFREELIARGLPDKIQWGINTRVTDILRDEELLPLYREARLLHVTLGTKAAAQLKLDRFNKETKVADTRKAIRLLREAGIVVAAQFIVGLENKTKETLEETYRMAMEWKPDLANWSTYTPWPFTQLFNEMSDKVEVFDFEKYNFVTPIIRPEAMGRAELLDRVMNNYRRFYVYKALFSYPWAGLGQRRRYLLGCLKAVLKAGFERKFYDLGKVGYWGSQSKKKVDFHFDAERTIAPAQVADWEAAADRSRKMKAHVAEAKACGGGTEQIVVDDDAASAKACGGGSEQMADAEVERAPTFQ